MNVKTITAPTIHAALIEARRILGDGVVLLESIPPQGDQPARITVMADQPNRTVQAPITSRANQHAVEARATERRQAAPALTAGFGYRPEKRQESMVAAAEENTMGTERISGRNADSGRTVEARKDYSFDVGRRSMRDVAQSGDGSAQDTLPEVRRRGISGPAGRGQIFPNRGEMVPHTSTQSGTLDGIEALLQGQLKMLHDRLDQIERKFERAIIGAAQEWTVNPLFGSMLNHGFRPRTVTRLFDALAKKGYQPDTNAETLKWALAQEVRRTMNVASPKQIGGAQVFIGPSGAGKTSLLLKLARHPGFYGRRETAVIVIEPEESGTAFHHSPVDLYRIHGLPVQSARTTVEMRQAIMRVQHFDHILIDTPPMPLQKAAAAKAVRHIKMLVDPIMPLRVQFVLNATRSLGDFNPDFISSLPLRPETIALTHLDETQGWGRIAEWLMSLKMPVQ
ncbi:MAG: hypothetical protein WED81_01225, partial [Rhodothermales bacterium]